jgi:ubiquinol-cytochrome c reductase cytochrome c subunit
MAGVAVLLVGLLAAGIAFTAINTGTSAQAATATASQSQVEAGRQLYLEGCATCHGIGGQGTENNPPLIGVGAAAVHFQVSTGRMPLAAPAVQAVERPPVYTDEQVAQLAAYVASLGAGPPIPTAADLDYSGADLAQGGVLFRTNCQQCHNFAGKGGALSEGGFAPSLMNATPQLMWEAMITGPQQMPIFSNQTLPPESKQDIIKYVRHLQDAPDPGGLALGSLGPVTEGVFVWVAGLGALLAAAVWIGAKVR